MIYIVNTGLPDWTIKVLFYNRKGGIHLNEIRKKSTSPLPIQRRTQRKLFILTILLLPHFSNDSTSIVTFSSLSKNAPNPSESTSGMAPAPLGAATTTGAASTAGAPDRAPLILTRTKIPKYPPMMAPATVCGRICLVFVRGFPLGDKSRKKVLVLSEELF